MTEYTTGTGEKLVNIHPPEACAGRSCVIHNPITDKPQADWPTHWRSDRALFERICPCGVGHPAREHLEFIRRIDPERAKWEGIHGCCGCCTGSYAS